MKYITKTAVIKTAQGKKRIYAYGKTEKEAVMKLAKVVAEYEAGLRTFSPRTRFDKWAASWLEYTYRPSVQDSTYKGAKSRLEKYILPVLGYMELSDIKKQNITQIYYSMQDMSADTIHKTHQTVSRILAEAVDNGLIPNNPAERMTLPKGKQSTPRRALTAEEQEQFIHLCQSHRYGALFGIMLACGLRPQEVRALRWQDIDFKSRTVSVRQAVETGKRTVKAPKSAAGLRSIPVPEWYMSILRGLVRPLDKELIFIDKHGNTLHKNAIADAWRSFLRSWDIQQGAEVYRNHIITHAVDQTLTPYYLRHTYATNLAERGVDIKTAQYLLGHATIQMTAEVYTHVTPKMIETARAKMEL